jgi:hypothetical protein
MMAILTVEGRKRFGANRFSGSVDDQAEAYKTMNACHHDGGLRSS